MLATLFELRNWGWLVVGVAVSALLAALAMQYWGGLPPCNLCMYQRYAYLGLIVIAVPCLSLNRIKLAVVLICLMLLVEAGIAFYHWGVELGFVPLPQACLGVDMADDFEAFKASILADKPRCDEIAGQFLGLSIAAWNALLASGLLVVSLVLLWRGTQSQVSSA